MAKRVKQDYKKIYSARYIMGNRTLYAGKDHFLVAVGTSFSEEYFRFFYSDIQCLKLRTVKGFWLSVIVWSVLALGFGTLALLFDFAAVFWWIMAGISAIGLVWLLIKGPKSFLTFKTVTTSREFPLGNERGAFKAIDKMRPYLVAAQQEYNEVELCSELDADEKEYQV